METLNFEKREQWETKSEMIHHEDLPNRTYGCIIIALIALAFVVLAGMRIVFFA